MDVRMRFNAVWGPDGWRVDASEPAAAGPLEELFREQLALQSLPSHLPVVGHCAFGARYCVFARRPGDPVVRGLLLDPDEYRGLEFDPFVAGARLVGEPILVELTREPPTPAPPRPVRETDSPEYLGQAYACFLGAPPAGRRESYLSLLPAGTPAQVSPLSCFVAGSGGPPPAGQEHGGGHFGALELAREADPAAPSAPPPATPTAGDDPVARLLVEHRRLRRALLVTWVALVLVAAVAAGAAWVGRGRLEALERNKLDAAVLAEGLGVVPDERAREEALRASLRDLATVSVQSGAWQSGLESRGVAPDEFLGTMVELAARAEALHQLAGSAGSLTRLAPVSGDLLTVARSSEPLAALAAAAPAALAVAERAPALTALAERAPALTALAERDQALRALAAVQADVEAVARLRPQLERLSARATALANLAEQGAPLLVFFERRQAALQTLAELQPALSELAARRPALERLAAASGPLLNLSDSRGLRQLAAQDAEVAVLAQHLGELTELARRAEELLGPGAAP